MYKRQYHELTRSQLRSPSLLTDSEIAEVLEHIDDLDRWTHEVKDYAVDLTVSHGKRWPGYKIAEGRPIYRHKDEKAIARIAGTNDIHNIYQQKLLPATELEKQLSKKKLAELSSQGIMKPADKSILVPNSDRRQSISKSNPKDEPKEE